MEVQTAQTLVSRATFESQCRACAAFLGKTNGRDKLFRLLQFLARLVRGTSGSVSVQQTALHVEMTLSSSRQTFRLFKFLNVLAANMVYRVDHGALVDVIQSLADLAIAMWFVLDNMSWLCKAKLFARGDAAQFSRRAGRFWFLNSVLNVVVKLLMLRQLQEQAAESRAKADASQVGEPARAEMKLVEKQQRLCMLDLSRSVLDLPISYSMTQLPKQQFSPSLTGACGVISSVIGCWQQWPGK
ncbi:Peroxisomal membrane protein 11D [Porphyridium purpureum]|uniref:Peroxisomal membrane protein 11D n=1 Tax=Porphyridium purpureum TaxID=35688 RepID=A0A5J4YT20_PORPP|nr:Peroxisomal membrane protein 11D [Porphyridium purpureum]|eukprot:POR7577..scf227_4